MTLIQTEPKSIKIWTIPIKRVTIRPNGTEKQIRPAWWAPWANTIAYRPLNSTSTINDMKWHWTAYNLTASWNPSYWTLWVTLTWQKLGLPSIPEQAKTVCCWLKINSWNTWTYAAVYDLQISGSILWRIWTKSGNNVFIAQSDKPSTKQWSLSNRDDWKRKLLCFTWDNNVCTLYINWQQEGTVNSWSSMPWQPIVWVMGWTINEWTQNCDISEFIIESVARTAQEVSDYYNLTKWNYWL